MTHKRELFLGLGLSAAFLTAMSGQVAAKTARNAPAPPAVLSAIDYSTGTILMDQNLDRRIVPASITKFMTMIITLDDIRAGNSNWDDVVKMSAYAGTQGYSDGFAPGTQYTLQDLSKAALVRSNNRAATAIAEHGGNGSMRNFVARMNQKAALIGMTHTNFVDSSGLSNSNKSTPRDLLLMGRYFVANYPEFIDLFAQTEYHGQENTNKLLYRDFEGERIEIMAGKTGTLKASGSCLLVIARKDDDVVIALSMGSPDRFVRDTRLSNALVEAFNRQADIGTFANQNTPKIGTSIALPQSLQTYPTTPTLPQAELAVSHWPSYRMTDAKFTQDLSFADAFTGTARTTDLLAVDTWETNSIFMPANRNDVPAELGALRAEKPAASFGGSAAAHGGAPLAPR